MFCKNCGQEMNDNQAICLRCGVKTGQGASFCANCGQPVNPEAEVYVLRTNTWNDKEKEIAAANTLIETYDVDLLTYHQNQPNVIEAAEVDHIFISDQKDGKKNIL